MTGLSDIDYLSGAPPSTDDERDAVFCERYVTYEAQHKPDAHILAFIDAGLEEVQWPIAVAAERHLNKAHIQKMLPVVRRMMKAMQPLAAEVTRERAEAEMQDIQEKAIRDRQYSPAIKAAELKYKLAGLITDQININHNITVSTMSDADLEKIAASKKPVVLEHIADPETLLISGPGK